MLLPGRKRVCFIPLQIGGNSLVESVLLFGRLKGASNKPTLSIPHKFDDLTSQGAPAESAQTISQAGGISAIVDVLRSERCQVTKQPVINQCRKAIEFEQGVLQRGRRQKQLFAIFCCPSDTLAQPIAFPVGITELVGFINNHKIPGNLFEFFRPAGGKVHGANDDLLVPEWVRNTMLLLVFIGFCIQNDGWQIKLFGELQRPLLPKRGRTDDQNVPSAFCPVLTQYKTCLNGLAKADLVGEQHTL